MQGRDQDRKQKSNYGGGGGEGSSVHVCPRCRWQFSNAHPSQKKRAAHKKHCGKIEGYPLVIATAQCDGERVEEGSVGNFSNGSSVTMNFEEMALEEEKNLENAGANLEVRGMIEADSFEEADRTPNTGASEAEHLERNDTENDNMKMAKYGDIAAKQLDSIVEFQDNMSLDCSTDVSSSFQPNNDSFDCSTQIKYPLQPKSDLFLAQKSIHEKEPPVDLEDEELACITTSTILPEYSSSNLEGIDLKLHVPRDGKAEPGGECQLGITSVDLFNSWSPVIIACPGDITKSNQIGTTSEKLSNYSLSPRTNASWMNIESPELAKPVDVALLFASSSAEALIQPVNQSENDLEGTQIDTILLPHLPALDIHLDEVEDLSRVSAHSKNPEAHNDGENPIFVSDIRELYKAEIPVANVSDVLEDITCDNSTAEVHFEDHRATSNDVITSSVQLQVDGAGDSSGKVASCLDLSPDISCQDDIQNRNSTFDHANSYIVEEKMGCHTNNARDDSENDSHASQEGEQKEMQNNKKLCIESGFNKHTDEDNLFYRGCTDLGNVALNDTENASLASQECEEKELQNNRKLCIESGLDTHTDEGNAFCHRSIYLGNDAINNTENDSLASQECEEKEMQNNQKLCLESGFDTHTREDNMFYHGGTNLGNDDIRENEFKAEEPTENIICPNIVVTKNLLESISDVGLTLHDIEMDTQKKSMLNDVNASVGFTSKVKAGIRRDESESSPEHLNDHLNSNHGNQFGINCYNPKHPIDNGCCDQSETIQPSQDSNSCKEANICAVSEEVASSKENQPLVDNFLNNDKENSDDLVFVDASDGIIDQRECTEGYCVPKFDKLGATANSSQENACNLLTDVPCDPDGIETGQQLTAEIRPIVTDEQFTCMSRNANLSPQNKANESHGWKKKNEIKSRMVDWQHLKDGIVEESKKPHVPLKNLLGEGNHEGKNSLKNSLEQMVFSPSREADTLQNGYSKENIQTSMNESERSPVRADAKVMQKEWSSPARLPVNKNTKGKTKGKPQWTPFMCCSSNAI